MRKTTYAPKKSKNLKGKDKSALNQRPQNIHLNQEKKEGLSDTPKGIGLLVKAITDGIKEVIEAMNKNNERLIKVLTSGNTNRMRINDSQNNNIMDNNIKEDSKVNNNMLKAKKNENIRFENSHNINKDKIGANNAFTNMNWNSIFIIEGNNNINEPSHFSIKSKSLIKKNDSSSHNNSSGNKNNINITKEMNSSDNSVPKRNALIKYKKKENSLKINQNIDFKIYKSSLTNNPFLPNYYNKKKKSHSFIRNKNA